MQTLTTAQASYDFATPTDHPLTATCENLATALHDALQTAGFDADGVEVEPDGELEVLVSCSPFPTISIVLKPLPEMVKEWADEISYRMLSGL